MTNNNEPSPPVTVDAARGNLWVMPLLAAVLFAGIGFLMLFDPKQPAPTDQETPTAAIGKRLAGFKVDSLIGESPALAENDLVGRVTLVNFWGPWCGPCRMEMPEFAQLQAKLADEARFRFISIACSSNLQSENVDQLQRDVAEYLREEGFSFPVHADPGGASRRALAAVNGTGRLPFPTTVLLDRDGVIRHHWEGYAPGIGKMVERRIAELLK